MSEPLDLVLPALVALGRFADFPVCFELLTTLRFVAPRPTESATRRWRDAAQERCQRLQLRRQGHRDVASGATPAGDSGRRFLDAV